MRVNGFLILMILYFTLILFFSDRNFFKYLALLKDLKLKQTELEKISTNSEELERNINLLYNRDLDFIEELLKIKFNLKLKSEYVVYFKKDK